MVHGCLFMGLARWSFTVFSSFQQKISGATHLSGRTFRSKIKYHPITIFTKTALLGTALELVIGWLLNTFFHLRYWDYSSYPYNFHGYICLFQQSDLVSQVCSGSVYFLIYSENTGSPCHPVSDAASTVCWYFYSSQTARPHWFSQMPGMESHFNLQVAPSSASLISGTSTF